MQHQNLRGLRPPSKRGRNGHVKFDRIHIRERIEMRQHQDSKKTEASFVCIREIRGHSELESESRRSYAARMKPIRLAASVFLGGCLAGAAGVPPDHAQK